MKPQPKTIKQVLDDAEKMTNSINRAIKKFEKANPNRIVCLNNGHATLNLNSKVTFRVSFDGKKPI
jgi:hypothetical protein